LIRLPQVARWAFYYRSHGQVGAWCDMANLERRPLGAACRGSRPATLTTPVRRPVLLARVVLGDRLRWVQRAGLALAAIGILLVTV
jgi:hypothetical protein